MQLVLKYGAPIYGGAHDIVVVAYPDDLDVDMGQFPGCRLAPWQGNLDDLSRVGPEPLDPAADPRSRAAPTDIDLVAYTALVRYYRENGTIKVKIGSDSAVPLATARSYRDGYRDTLLGILSGVRQDGAAFKCADGVSRPATNSEIQTAIAAVYACVQTLYDTESDTAAKVRAGKIKTLDQVNAAFAAVPT